MSGARRAARYWVEPSFVSANPQAQRIDLAIVEVEDTFQLSAEVQPIRMCTNSSCFTPFGSPVVVSGFGQTISDLSLSTTTRLRSANLFTVSDDVCRVKFESNFGCSDCLLRTDVCAGAPDQNVCFGDSGGPLVRDFGGAEGFRLVGVVASTTQPSNDWPSCGAAGEYGLFVSVPANRAWIERVLSGQEEHAAVTSVCVAAGNCTSVPGTGFPTLSSRTWLYIVLGTVAAVLCLASVVLWVIVQCLRGRDKRVGAMEPVRHVSPQWTPQDSSALHKPRGAPKLQLYSQSTGTSSFDTPLSDFN